MPGFNGSGGGARSGSELSHLRFRSIDLASFGFKEKIMYSTAAAQHTPHTDWTYIGIDERPLSENDG